MLLFRALAKNMAPMTNADESPTNRLTLFPIYLSLFIVSTLCPNPGKDTVDGEILQKVFYTILCPKIKGFTAMHGKLRRVAKLF